MNHGRSHPSRNPSLQMCKAYARLLTSDCLCIRIIPHVHKIAARRGIRGALGSSLTCGPNRELHFFAIYRSINPPFAYIHLVHVPSIFLMRKLEKGVSGVSLTATHCPITQGEVRQGGCASLSDHSRVRVSAIDPQISDRIFHPYTNTVSD